MAKVIKRGCREWPDQVVDHIRRDLDDLDAEILGDFVADRHPVPGGRDGVQTPPKGADGAPTPHVDQAVV